MRLFLVALLLTLGTLAGLPLLVVIPLLAITPITLVGFLYLLGYLLIVSGLLSVAWWRRRSLIVFLLGTSLILITIGARLLFPPSGSQLDLLTLPDQSAPRLWNRVFNEQDVVLFGARVAPYMRLVSPAEDTGLVAALAEKYRALQGVTPLSPFLATYLYQQRPDAFDALIAEPATDTRPKRGIIFLHGFGGNFTLQCWLIAHAGDRIGALTICPSTGPFGDWWSASGEMTLQNTLSYLQQRGVERIYLAGLSNGGIGASRLAQRFESELAGLILISGADPDARITRLPVLVVQGKDDHRIPASVVERYVAAAGASSTYILRDGDHFVLLKQADQLQDTIAGWITRQEAR